MTYHTAFNSDTFYENTTEKLSNANSIMFTFYLQFSTWLMLFNIRYWENAFDIAISISKKCTNTCSKMLIRLPQAFIMCYKSQDETASDIKQTKSNGRQNTSYS